MKWALVFISGLSIGMAPRSETPIWDTLTAVFLLIVAAGWDAGRAYLRKGA